MFRLAGLEAFSILALTVSLSLARPRIGSFRFQPATAGVLGAILSLLTGLVPVELALSALRLLFLPIITIVSLMVVTIVAERAGLFDLLAESIAIAARGDGRRLFAYIFAGGTATGMLFTNDAAVLIFTPLVFQLIERVQDGSWTLRNKIPYYFAVLYVANLVGVLVTSNPINIVVSSLFGISFFEYARWMFLPAMSSILVTFAGLYLFFRESVPRTFEYRPQQRSYNRTALVLCSIALFAILVGFFSESLTGAPTWLVACSGAIVLLGVHATVARVSEIPSILRGVSWDVLVFLTSIFIVVVGLRRVGLTAQLGESLSALSFAGTWAMTLGTSLLAAVSSAVMNNHPTADLMGWAIRDLSAPASQGRLMAFSALIGGDLGPKMLPIGSLAALIWFRLLRDRGVHISYWLYIRIGIPVTLAAILVAVLTLNLEVILVSWWTR